jgi:hypothetical protein
MPSDKSLHHSVKDTRRFEDDMDAIPVHEPSDDGVEKFDDDEDVRYWLDSDGEPRGTLGEFRDDLSRIRDGVLKPVGTRVVWAGRNFVQLGFSRYCLLFFLIFVFLAIYFGTLLHETLHIVAASFVGEIPVGIRLNAAIYSQVGSVLSMATGGFVQTASMDSNNPGSALIHSSGNPLHTAFIGIFPNIIMFMLGFTWLRKGLNETRPAFFAVGLVFTCSNLEIFIPSLRTDVTPTANYVAGSIGVTGDDIGAITFIVAAAVFGSGYILSVVYDRWQRKLVTSSPP